MSFLIDNMKLEQPLKILNLTPSQDLLNFDYSTIDWTLFTSRQNTFKVHRDTLTFPFVNSEFFISSDIIYRNINHPIYPIILEELLKLEEYFSATVRIAGLAGIKPNGTIYKHVDKSELFQYAHRVHLPLVTNPGVIFTIDNTDFHLEKGTWYEIDNTRPHQVINNCQDIRIHLLVDLLPNVIKEE